MMVAASFFGANAQTVVSDEMEALINGTSEQSTTVTPVNPVTSTVADEEENRVFYSFVYYGFDGFQNYGISDYFYSPNGLGFDFNIRMNFKKYGNYNVDLMPNYSIQLFGNDYIKLLVTLSAGGSFRIQDVPEYTSNGKLKDKTQFKFDFVTNPRLTFIFGDFTVSSGYFIWGQEFKLSKANRATGFNVSLGYDL